MTDDASAYQATAQVKAQEIANNQEISEEKPKHLHKLVKEAAHRAVLTNAVNHLNQQSERGEHAPDFDPGSQAVS